jgi:transposase-like protein
VVMPNITTGPTAAAADAAAKGRKRSVVPAPASANPELSGRPRRRTFTAAEKLRILQEADGAAAAGAIGALLRRQGLYSSALTEWRRQREAGVLRGLTPARRGPKPPDINPLADTLVRGAKVRAAAAVRLAESALGHSGQAVERGRFPPR